MSPHSEMGDELKPWQLEARTVVILRADHMPTFAITCWVLEKLEGFIVFRLGEVGIDIGLDIVNGKLVDDAGHVVRAHRYLGEIDPEGKPTIH